MARSRTTFAPGNQFGRLKGKTQDTKIQEALQDALISVCNSDRKKAFNRLKRVDPELAEQFFGKIDDGQTALQHFFEKMVAMAAYDKTALKLVADRVAPRPKHPMINLGEEMAKLPPDQAAAKVAEYVAAGVISADHGDSLIRVFAGAAQIREMEANTRLMSAMADEEEGLKNDD